MKKTFFFSIILIVGLFLSCDKKIDNLQLVEKLQIHIDELINQGYQIDRVAISSESFKDHGSSATGQFERLYVCAVPPDPTINYLANFSILDISSTNELTFLGYPTNSNNKKKNKIYNAKPSLAKALSRLDEVKSQIPENYKYERLLELDYLVEADGQAVYEFRIEVKPDSKDTTHPKVRKETLSHTTVSNPSSRRKSGIGKTKTTSERKEQYYITCRLSGNQIKIK